MKRFGLPVVVIVLCIGSAAALVFWLLYQEPEPEKLPLPVPAIKPRTGSLVAWGCGQPVDVAVWKHVLEVVEKEHRQPVDLVTWPDPGTYLTQLANARKTGLMPDVFLLEDRDLTSLVESRALLPLPAPKPPHPILAEALTRDKELYAYPADFSVLALYYNEKFFRRSGLAFPNDHWTWETFLAISRSLFRAAEPSRPALWGLEFPLTLEFWNALSRQAGTPVYEGDTWLANQAPVESQTAALQFILDFYQSYNICPRRPPPDTATWFEKGQTALLVAGPEWMPRLAAQHGFIWGIAPLPKNTHRATSVRVNGWAVSSRTDKPEIAQKIAFQLAQHATRRGWLPAWKEPGATDRIFYDALDHALPVFTGPNVSAIESHVKSQLLAETAKSRTLAITLLDRINAAVTGKASPAP
jgi:multiple sugar transport system substrate-binding protein